MSNNAFIQRLLSTLQLSPSILASFKIVICAMTIIHFAIGAAYLDECPRQHFIPIYLVMAGWFGMVLAVLSFRPPAHEPSDGSTTLSRACTALTSALFFCWFITGNVWIYSIYEPNYNKNTTDVSTYCNKTLYLFAFWTTTLVYILLGLFLVISCCVLFCLFLRGHADPDSNV